MNSNYSLICNEIKIKEEQLCDEFKKFDGTKFVLNKKIFSLVKEIEELNNQKVQIEEEQKNGEKF